MELKPCPFCVSDAEMHFDRLGGKTIYMVKCSVSKCQCQEMGWHETEDEAIAIWNTRPIEEALQARITELEKQVVVWHKYPDEKPDSGKECLVLFDEGDYFLDTYNDTIGWMGCLYEYLEHITHWAYLPEAPREEGND